MGEIVSTLAAYNTTAQKLETLKAADKTKTATYRQLLGDNLMLQAILHPLQNLWAAG